MGLGKDIHIGPTIPNPARVVYALEGNLRASRTVHGLVVRSRDPRGKFAMADPPVDAPVVASQSDQLPDRGAGFRIRLHHLFAVTAVLAAQLAIAGPQGLLDLPNQSAGSLQTIQLVCGLAHVIPTSIALTALGYGIVAYRRGQLFFNQPGHWLLVEISLITLLSIPTTLVMRWIAADGRLAHSDSDFALFLMIDCGVFAAGAGGGSDGDQHLLWRHKMSPVALEIGVLRQSRGVDSIRFRRSRRHCAAAACDADRSSRTIAAQRGALVRSVRSTRDQLVGVLRNAAGDCGHALGLKRWQLSVELEERTKSMQQETLRRREFLRPRSTPPLAALCYSREV